MTLVSEYPAWIWVLPPLIAFLITQWFYRKRGFPELSPVWARGGMWAGRFIGLTILLLLLTGPLIKSSHTTYEKPLVAIIADNSQSMGISAKGSSETDKIKSIIKELPAELSEKADLRFFSMSDGIMPWTDSTEFDGKISDISASFEQLATGYSGLNLAAVVVLSDGLYNRGEDPLNAIKRLKAPVYTIPLGDTIKRNDLILSSVKHNRTAYVGNDFPVEAGVEVNGFRGKTITLNISEEGRILSSSTFTPSANRQFFNLPFLLKAGKKGLHAYTVKIIPLPGEFTSLNNTRTFYIEVLDGKQKILFLSKGPHPDIAAIRQSLEAAEVYETSYANADDFRGGFEPYSLVVLHRLPDAASRNKPWFSALNTSTVSRLVIAGENMGGAEMNQVQRAVVYSSSKATPNEVSPILNKDFRLFNADPSWTDAMAEWPPLSVPYGSWNLTNGSEVLFKQRIGSVSTNNPLMAFGETDGVRSGVIAGEGIWKWRMAEFAARRNNEVFRSLISKSIQFLSAKRDSRPFFVSARQLYNQGEDLLFDASLINESGEKVLDAEIKMDIVSASGKNYPFYFSPSGIGYRLNAGQLDAGKYSWIATVKLGEKIYTDRGSFNISDLNLESMNLSADFALMDAIAASSGGKVLKPEAKEIAAALLNSDKLSSIAREEKTVKDLIDLKWLFFLMLSAFSLEWFLRRYCGGY